MNFTSNKLSMKHLILKRRHILILACILIAVGYLLMAGPADADIFSARCIVIAPAFCLLGYLLIIVGILWRD